MIMVMLVVVHGGVRVVASDDYDEEEGEARGTLFLLAKGSLSDTIRGRRVRVEEFTSCWAHSAHAKWDTVEGETVGLVWL